MTGMSKIAIVVQHLVSPEYAAMEFCERMVPKPVMMKITRIMIIVLQTAKSFLGFSAILKYIAVPAKFAMIEIISMEMVVPQIVR